MSLMMMMKRFGHDSSNKCYAFYYNRMVFWSSVRSMNICLFSCVIQSGYFPPVIHVYMYPIHVHSCNHY